ncbi:MAG: hypothetical protein CVU72_02130 [Deltaproteobacteria bacterium HGW-Deltaproteobacteria-7]|nr:MAG: hypothetical protein CVU72_02130 [Deltaproteobacteria bacterium HGW-Deltaproteobacteria-7]PKN21015.1 MAG: hypothetical protein CVU71_00165 [Deltaproteobacteria bacterium HGW-Deltaproteobacteria-6]
MIIQCKQCRTKFRFDDAQIVGDGLWVRCSRCQHVFFQDNLKRMNVTDDLPQTNPASPQNVAAGRTGGKLAFEPVRNDVGKSAPDEDVASFLNAVMEPEKTAGDNLKRESRQADRQSSGLADIEFSPGFENLEEMHESEDASEETTPPPVRKKSGLWKVALWTILVIAVIPAIVYFVVFPQLGERYMKLGEHFVNIALNAVGVSQPTQGQFVTGQVKLQDIRQRVINNYILGNIRVVEGTAVNQAEFSMARILVKGEVLDAYAVVLGERVSYAGNVLTEEELTNLSEEEILKRLSVPAGLNNSNDRVIPNGRIPFMIIFTRDVPGIIKTTVMIAGAERLL